MKWIKRFSIFSVCFLLISLFVELTGVATVDAADLVTIGRPKNELVFPSPPWGNATSKVGVATGDHNAVATVERLINQNLTYDGAIGYKLVYYPTGTNHWGNYMSFLNRSAQFTIVKKVRDATNPTAPTVGKFIWEETYNGHDQPNWNPDYEGQFAEIKNSPKYNEPVAIKVGETKSFQELGIAAKIPVYTMDNFGSFYSFWDTAGKKNGPEYESTVFVDSKAKTMRPTDYRSLGIRANYENGLPATKDPWVSENEYFKIEYIAAEEEFYLTAKKWTQGLYKIANNAEESRINPLPKMYFTEFRNHTDYNFSEYLQVRVEAQNVEFKKSEYAVEAGESFDVLEQLKVNIDGATEWATREEIKKYKDEVTDVSKDKWELTSSNPAVVAVATNQEALTPKKAGEAEVTLKVTRGEITYTTKTLIVVSQDETKLLTVGKWSDLREVGNSFGGTRQAPVLNAQAQAVVKLSNGTSSGVTTYKGTLTRKSYGVTPKPSVTFTYEKNGVVGTHSIELEGFAALQNDVRFGNPLRVQAGHTVSFATLGMDTKLTLQKENGTGVKPTYKDLGFRANNDGLPTDLNPVVSENEYFKIEKRADDYYLVGKKATEGLSQATSDSSVNPLPRMYFTEVVDGKYRLTNYIQVEVGYKFKGFKQREYVMHVGDSLNVFDELLVYKDADERIQLTPAEIRQLKASSANWSVTSSNGNAAYSHDRGETIRADALGETNMTFAAVVKGVSYRDAFKIRVVPVIHDIRFKHSEYTKKPGETLKTLSELEAVDDKGKVVASVNINDVWQKGTGKTVTSTNAGAVEVSADNLTLSMKRSGESTINVSITYAGKTYTPSTKIKVTGVVTVKFKQSTYNDATIKVGGTMDVKNQLKAVIVAADGTETEDSTFDFNALTSVHVQSDSNHIVSVVNPNSMDARLEYKKKGVTQVIWMGTDADGKNYRAAAIINVRADKPNDSKKSDELPRW